MIGADSVSHICTSFAIKLFPPNYGKQFVDVEAYYINPVPKNKKKQKKKQQFFFFIAFCLLHNDYLKNGYLEIIQIIII